jgi:hypothetical protein
MNEKAKKYIANEGNDVKIVILDSGVRLSHPKLSQYTVNGYNIIEDSFDIEDYLGHGTAVTGIIKHHVPRADIFLVKSFEYDYTIEFEDLCRSLDYINDNIDFDLLNLSVGITECPDHERLESLCQSLSQKGILISAFHNFGAISYPAAYPCVIGVDSNLQYTKPFEYDFIENEIINIRAKGGNQRLLWNKPDYMIQSGSSFACAHITGLVAKMIQGKKPSIDAVMTELRENATATYKSQKYRDNSPIFQIDKGVCFPYNKEIDTLCRNESLLSFKLVDVYDSKYNFNIGKITSSGKVIKNIEQLDWDADFDTIILGHISNLAGISKVDYYRHIIELCKKHNKNIFQFDPVKNERKIYSPNILPEYIPPLNYGKLYMIGKPVIAVFGTSSRQGKFSLQIALRKEFILRGYTVGQLGTEPQSHLFGFDESFPCGFGTELNLDEQTAIGYINYLLHKVEMKNPDIIIVGGQSGLVPYAMYNIGNNSPYQRELLLASNPDAMVLCVNFFDDIDYIQRTIKYAESLTENKVIALSIFPFDRAFSWSSVSSNLKPVEPELLEQQIRFFEKEIGIKVFSQSQAKQLCEEIINHLSQEEKSVENYLLSSLLPFIDEGEITYYAQVAEDVLLHLISLAPFVNDAENLRKLSKLNLEELAKASELLPVMDPSKKEDYFSKLKSV